MARVPARKHNKVTPKQTWLFIEKYKGMFGFAEYKATVKDRGEVKGDTACEINVDWLERTLEVSLFDNYYTSDRDWRSDIIHEFIHGALGRMQDEVKKKQETLQYYEEEKFVNTLTDAMMRFVK